VTRLLALVADTVLLRRALAGEMADLAAVVALLSLSAVAGKMSVSAARVAGLGALLAVSTGTGTVSTRGTTSRALTGDVSDLAALVALSTTTGGTETALAAHLGSLSAVAGKMTRLSAAVARLLLLGAGALAGHVTILATVVADGGTALRAFPSLMTGLAAVVASTSTAVTAVRRSSVAVHFDVEVCVWGGWGDEKVLRLLSDVAGVGCGGGRGEGRR